jgi:hypothetical protein
VIQKRLFPQPVKPAFHFSLSCGTAKAVPFQNMIYATVPALEGILLWQSARGDLGNVYELRGGFALRGECILKHGIAEGTGCAYGAGSGCGQFGGAGVADALAGFFAEEGEAAAGSATEAALAIARGFDELAGERGNGTRFVIDIAIAA